ncbi:YGGT family protein [Perilla frutescens var. hirtella]|uniref:YGGT family protein n=1 Tax=Perilla frutescens var. hirtella TaxID=608512 RepID=A0AAD4JC48_PERFH|nr:YGGT family protein [Perilla frutescens var. hirtella]
MEPCSTSMEEDLTFAAKTPSPNLQIFPISSIPFDFIRSPPFSRQPSKLLVGASNGFRELQKSIDSNVDKFLQLVDKIRCQNGILDKNFMLKIRRQNLAMVSSPQKFAAILPGDSVAGVVVANGILNFLNIYNTLLVVRLVLTWFPNAPPAVVSPLSTLCDPYLNIFRGIIPPLGGLDLSPILAFLVLNAFTSTASALPCELPPTNHTTSSQDKWIKRLARTRPRTSKADDI